MFSPACLLLGEQLMLLPQRLTPRWGRVDLSALLGPAARVSGDRLNGTRPPGSQSLVTATGLRPPALFPSGRTIGKDHFGRIATNSDMQPTPRIPVPREPLAALCKRHHIRKLSFFGSVLRDDFGPASDIDVLIEFDPAFPVGFRIFDVEQELSQLFGGRRIDIVNPKYLNRHLRDRVLADAIVQYAA